MPVPITYKNNACNELVTVVVTSGATGHRRGDQSDEIEGIFRCELLFCRIVSEERLQKTRAPQTQCTLFDMVDDKDKSQKSATPGDGPAAKKQKKNALIDFYAQSLQSNENLKDRFIQANSYVKVSVPKFDAYSTVTQAPKDDHTHI
eukprot:1178547-Prorocentrum_minimum.AAC.2